MPLEIACFNTESALVAQASGADRIEFCGGPFNDGGLTPALSDLQTLRKELTIPLHVMIRPRPGPPIYTEVEFQQMCDVVVTFGNSVDGFVLGVLDERGDVHVKRCQKLLALAKPKRSVFHRGFDEARDSIAALKALGELGFAGVLTSGVKEAPAMQGAGNIAEYVREFGNKIEIIVGGGVRSDNARSLRDATNASWFHSSAIKDRREVADGEEVRRLKQIVDEWDARDEISGGSAVEISTILDVDEG
jgi:copper homeostasis protein